MKLAIILFVLFALTACDYSSGSSGQVAEAERESGEPAFPEITTPYTMEKAIQNGDVVPNFVKTGMDNREKWDHFLESLKMNREDQVRITEFTVEGGPILSELVYDGESIHFTYDNSMDTFGQDLGRPQAKCTDIGTEKNDDGQKFYVLKGCDNVNGGYFHVPKF